VKDIHIPKKSFGQNFLTAPYYVDRIVDAVPATSGEVVVEIGPGKGALSSKLIKRDFSFNLIEKDEDVVPFLKDALGDKGYELHLGDALKFDYSQLGESYHAVGNLPYNVASHIIKAVLLSAPRVKSVTFMVQKEVAERICAEPGGKVIGFLTILCSYFGEATKLFDVPPGAFYPKPKVTSSIFQINLDRDCFERLGREKWEPFFKFVSVGFSMRRKKLANSIAAVSGGKKEAVEMIVKSGLEAGIRAEELTVDQWVTLYKQL
jgi:16S rRNA (adenine1518-N6/adenine1519-N6)-dimethyltransferase